MEASKEHPDGGRLLSKSKSGSLIELHDGVLHFNYDFPVSSSDSDKEPAKIRIIMNTNTGMISGDEVSKLMFSWIFILPVLFFLNKLVSKSVKSGKSVHLSDHEKESMLLDVQNAVRVCSFTDLYLDEFMKVISTDSKLSPDFIQDASEKLDMSVPVARVVWNWERTVERIERMFGITK